MTDLNNMETWIDIDQDCTDPEEIARLFIAQEVEKAEDLDEVDDTLEEWEESMGAELEFQLKQADPWLTEDNYDEISALVDELLPEYLEFKGYL